MRSVLACALFSLLGSAVAAEPSAVARARAQAALALTTAKAPTPAAPAPRVAAIDYATARSRAIEKGKPLVVYVGCSGKHELIRGAGFYVVSVAELSGYEAGTIVVCYPSVGQLWANETLKCPAEPAEIEKAVNAATKKIVPAPKVVGTLVWS